MFLLTIAPFRKQRRSKKPYKKEQVSYVGCMRNRKKPQEFFKLLAKSCGHYNLTLLYFSPKDVNMENGTVTGKVLINESWVEQEVEIPEFIDASTLCYKKYRDVMNYLNQVSTVSGEPIGSKGKIYRLLYENQQFKHIIIPYKSTKNPNTIIDFLFQYHEIVLKPTGGQQGSNIYKIELINENTFKVSYQFNEATLNKEELDRLLNDIVSNGRFICQKYIHSYDNNRNPFDIRIRLEKNAKGEWQVAINLVRIASAQKIVSNVAQGGYVAEIDTFLKVNYPENWESIYDSIKTIGRDLPVHIEEITEKKLCSLGIDLGLDLDGTPYFFEINTAPGVEFALGEIAMIKSGYYHYKMNT